MMNTLPRDKLCIGTAKFGMQYGVGNRSHQVDLASTQSVIEYCSNHGVGFFDTAPGYGESEAILGRFEYVRSARVVTKTLKICGDTVDQMAIEMLQDGFERSLHRMNVPNVYGLLVHNVEDLAKPGADKLVRWMLELQSRGLVKRVGASVYSPTEAHEIYSRYELDLIQLPVNVFDQRFLDEGTMEWLVERSVEIHARSLFLKGLLLQGQAPPGLPRRLLDHHQRFMLELGARNVGAFDLCMGFAMRLHQVDKWVLGFSNLQQLQHVVEWHDPFANTTDLDHQWLRDFCASWGLTADDIDPRKWSAVS